MFNNPFQLYVRNQLIIYKDDIAINEVLLGIEIPYTKRIRILSIVKVKVCREQLLAAVKRMKCVEC